jgi:hypothetical protein
MLLRFPTMPSETESLALHLIRGLYDAMDGTLMHWHSFDDLDVPQNAAAVRYATTPGWIQVESGNSVCPPATGPALDAAEPRPIEGLILFGSGAGLNTQQATQPNPEASRHVANADAQVVAPAA